MTHSFSKNDTYFIKKMTHSFTREKQKK